MRIKPFISKSFCLSLFLLGSGTFAMLAHAQTARIEIRTPNSSTSFTLNSPLHSKYRTGQRALQNGQWQNGLQALEEAASGGHPLALWQLGNLYENGDGVSVNPRRAFQYYSKIANSYADTDPNNPSARIVSRAFVRLGHFYCAKKPVAGIRSDYNRAKSLFTHAATYFGDPDAQYNLGQLYLEDNGVGINPRMAVRWLRMAARKNHVRAQAKLGEMLFLGKYVPEKTIAGLALIERARRHASSRDAQWVNAIHERIFSIASIEERRAATKNQ